jgi:hypothetical protein
MGRVGAVMRKRGLDMGFKQRGVIIRRIIIRELIKEVSKPWIPLPFFLLLFLLLFISFVLLTLTFLFTEIDSLRRMDRIVVGIEEIVIVR